MDKLEKIARINYLLEYQVELQGVGNDLSAGAKAQLKKYLADFGYRQLPKDKPPLLVATEEYPWSSSCLKAAKVQWDIWNEWYEGK